MKCSIRFEWCAELARLWGVMMMIRLILCVRIKTIWMWICDGASLRCNVSCAVLCCAGWCTIYAIYLWISINIVSRARMSQSAVFCCGLLVIKHYPFETFCWGKFKFVMPLNVHLFILYGHIIGVNVCLCTVYSWWLIHFALLIESHARFFWSFFRSFPFFFLYKNQCFRLSFSLSTSFVYFILLSDWIFCAVP